MTTKKLPKGFPHRTLVEPFDLTEFSVPRHILRIDRFRGQKPSVHGWEVRYADKDMLFTDRDLGGPKKALDAAIAYLTEIYEGPPTRVRTTPWRSKSNPNLEAGISERWRERQGNPPMLLNTASSPKKGVPRKEFYVGTINTVTEERYQAALERARAQRALFVASHTQDQNERGWI